MLRAEHLVNQEMKDLVDVKVKSFLLSNDQYFSFIDSSPLLQGPQAVSVCFSFNKSIGNNHEVLIVWESRSS
jgi:hypothetical protein